MEPELRGSGSLGQALSGRILGQEHAVEALVRAVGIGASGLGDPNRPVASLLFVGPTGVGKTEIVRTLATLLHGDPREFRRVDMSALAQEHYVASIAGAPPGYAGSKEGLTVLDRDQIERPDGTLGIVLFDEVEKAHLSVIRSLLHVLDNGILRLAGGKETYNFRRAVVVMTSNIGAIPSRRKRGSRGRARASVESRLVESIVCGRSTLPVVQSTAASLEGALDAEFLNRFDEVVLFDPIDESTAEQIAVRELGVVADRLQGLGIEARFDSSVTAWIVGRGFDAVYGARGIRRVIRREVLYPISCSLEPAKSNDRKGRLEMSIEGDRMSCHLSFGEPEGEKAESSDVLLSA